MPLLELDRDGQRRQPPPHCPERRPVVDLLDHRPARGPPSSTQLATPRPRPRNRPGPEPRPARLRHGGSLGLTLGCFVGVPRRRVASSAGSSTISASTTSSSASPVASVVPPAAAWSASAAAYIAAPIFWLDSPSLVTPALDLVGGGVGVLEGGLERVDVGLHLGLHVVGDLLGVLLEELLGGVDERVGLVAGLDRLAALGVLLGVLLGLLDHPVDLVLGRAPSRRRSSSTARGRTPGPWRRRGRCRWRRCRR